MSQLPRSDGPGSCIGSNSPGSTGFDKPHQGGPQRIDRGHAAGVAADALDHIEVIDTDDTRAATDHALVLYRFNRARLERVLTQAETAVCAR